MFATPLRLALSSIAALVVAAVAVVVVFAGPMRDTAFGHGLRGDLSKSDATTACEDEVKQRVPAFGATTFMKVKANFDSEEPSWVVTGHIEHGEIAGPWSCTVEWGKGGAWHQITELEAPGVR